MFEKINNFFSSKKNSNLIKEISDKYLNNINQLEADISNLSKGEMTHKIEKLKQNYISNFETMNTENKQKNIYKNLIKFQKL